MRIPRLSLAVVLLVIGLGVTAFAEDAGITLTQIQQVTDILQKGYGTSPDPTKFDLQNQDYTSLDSLVGNTTTEFGESQRMVTKALFAFGASMDSVTGPTTTWDIITGVIPIRTSSTTDTVGSSPQVGLLSGWIIVPSVLRAFIAMDIYLNSFFTASVYFALVMFLAITMGSAMIKQLHEGKLDMVSWIGKSTFAIICMFKTNMLCNYVLALFIGLAACFNTSIINGMTSAYGIDQWYLKVFGPQLTKNCYSMLTGTEKAEIAKAFSEPTDVQNISRYIMYENGAPTATTLCKYLGGAEGYNDANGANSQVAGVSLKDLTAAYCMMVVYNVGINNLNAHTQLGYSGIETDIANFKLGMARVYTGNDGLTSGDQGTIDKACNNLTISGAATDWAYLSTDALLKAAYRQPATVSLSACASAVTSRTSQSWYSSLWSKIQSYITTAVNTGSQIISNVGFLPSYLSTLLTQGFLQTLLLGGMMFWMLFSIALCKMGVIMVTLTSPFILLENMSKYFWTAVKTMVYPAMYPAFLIVIMQLTSALASWIGTIGGLTMGVGLILMVLPLIFGLVAVIFLPKLVKTMVSGGNVLWQMAGFSAKTAMAGAAVVATGGLAAGLAGAGAASGAAGAAAGSAGGGAAAAGSAAAAGGGGGPVMRAVSGAGRAAVQAMRAPIPGTRTTVGKAAFSTLTGGVPAMVWNMAKGRKAPKENV